MSESLRLNLGCGSAKIDDFVNIDVEESCKPDLICDFLRQPLPYEENAVDEVVMFHCIEHIRKVSHTFLLKQIWRVLKPDGRVIFSYPEFLKCVENWKTNAGNQKNFWEATLYGRQLYPSDHHVCIIHTPDFTEILRNIGFKDILTKPEPVEQYNTIVTGVKGPRPYNYEELLRMNMLDWQTANK